MPNILLSSVGRRVELARQLRLAYDRLGMFGRIVGTDIDWLAPAFQEVDEPTLLPRFTSENYLPELLKVCRDQEVDAIYPLHDGDLLVLSRFRKEIESIGVRLAVVEEAAADTCGDKMLTQDFFRRLGLPTARYWIPSQLPPYEQLEFPLFIKPRNGSAAENTFRINSVRELEFFIGYVPNPIVQEFLPGPEVTTDVICGLDGALLATASRQRIAVRGGEAIKSVTIHDERIIQACHEIAAHLPACGPFTVQCMMKDDVPHFIEINARMGGGIPLAIAAGVDVGGLLLSDLAGLSVSGLQIEAQVGVYMTRCDESFFLKENERDLSASRHIRSR